MKRRLGDGRYDIEKRYPEYPPEWDERINEDEELEEEPEEEEPEEEDECRESGN